MLAMKMLQLLPLQRSLLKLGLDQRRGAAGRRRADGSQSSCYRPTVQTY